jgi:hypothetical protein
LCKTCPRVTPSLVAGPPPQRLVRQVWRSPLQLQAARVAVEALARNNGAGFAIGGIGASAELVLLEEGTQTRVEATLGWSLAFAIFQWVVCCYALFFFGMTLAARMGEPFAPELVVLLVVPLIAIALSYAVALGAQRRLRLRVEKLLAGELRAIRL